MTYKVLTVGELIKDVHFEGMSTEEIREIQQEDMPRMISEGKIKSADDAGSSANLAAYTSLLGGQAILLTSTGRDKWGQELNNYLSKYDVDLRLAKDKSEHSDSALIHLDNKGVPNFVKFLLPAIPLIDLSDVNEEDILRADVVHISMMASAFKKSQAAVDKVITLAKKNAKTVSFDVNLRCGIYQNHHEMYNEINKLIRKADIIKFSAAEILFFAKMQDIKEVPLINEAISLKELISIAKEINTIFKPKILLVTLGGAGALGFSGEHFAWSSSYDFGETKNTVGAGDAFISAAINKFIEFGKKSLSEKEINKLLDFSSRIAGISVTGEQTIVDKVAEYKTLSGKRKFEDYNLFSEGVREQLIKEFDNYQSLIVS